MVIWSLTSLFTTKIGHLFIWFFVDLENFTFFVCDFKLWPPFVCAYMCVCCNHLAEIFLFFTFHLDPIAVSVCSFTVNFEHHFTLMKWNDFFSWSFDYQMIIMISIGVDVGWVKVVESFYKFHFYTLIYQLSFFHLEDFIIIWIISNFSNLGVICVHVCL